MAFARTIDARKLSRPLIGLFLTSVLLAGLIAIIRFSLTDSSPDILSFAVTMDLLVTVPLIWYLCMRKTSVPNTTIVPVLVAGLLIGTYLIPTMHQGYLDLFKQWVLPLVELSVLTYIVIKVRRAVRQFRIHSSYTPDFFTTLKRTSRELLPGRVAVLFATEVAVMYYGFVHWTRVSKQPASYTSHKRSGTPALLGAVMGILALETFALHVLLESWNNTVAWIVTGVSIYTVLQLFGFARSLSKRLSVLENNRLILRYGIMSETEIPLEDIASIELSRRRLPEDDEVRKLSPLGNLESHNVILQLKRPQVLYALYGTRKTYDTLAFHLDEPVTFKEDVEKIVQEL